MSITSENIISKHHHYLPIFYLKGFCDTDGLFYVFDKTNDNFLPKCKPDSKFYINHLNNYVHKGKPFFSYEEKYYTPMDTKGSKTFKEIRNANISEEDTISFETKIDFVWFLTNLYWRSPRANETLIKLIREEGLNNRYFGLYKETKDNRLTDKDVPEIKNQILTDSEIQKIFRTIMPHLDSNKEEMWKLLQNWMIYDVNNSGMIFGDSPIINNNKNLSLDNVFDEIIFPVSNNRLVIFGQKAPKFLDALLGAYINLAIYYSADRFICSDSKDKIIDVLNHRDELAKNGQTDCIIENLFKIKDLQSKFDTHKEYGEYVDYIRRNKK